MAEPTWDLADYAAEADLDGDAMARLLEAYGGARFRLRARTARAVAHCPRSPGRWLGAAPVAPIAERRSCGHARSSAARAADALGGSDYGRLLEGPSARRFRPYAGLHFRRRLLRSSQRLNGVPARAERAGGSAAAQPEEPDPGNAGGGK